METISTENSGGKIAKRLWERISGIPIKSQQMGLKYRLVKFLIFKNEKMNQYDRRR